MNREESQTKLDIIILVYFGKNIEMYTGVQIDILMIIGFTVSHILPVYALILFCQLLYGPMAMIDEIIYFTFIVCMRFSCW